MTKVLVYSQEPILVAGLESILRNNHEFELLPVCDAASKLVQQISVTSPDIVLLDFTPEIDLNLIAGMKGCKTVLWVSSISTEFAYQALGCGIRGILRKAFPTEVHLECLRSVAAGELWLEKHLTDSFLSARRVVLTRREGQLVTLLAQGMKNKEIATELNISEGSVKVYLSRLFQKVEVKDRFELALFALKNLNSKDTMGGSMQPKHRTHNLHSVVVPSNRPTVPPGFAQRPQATAPAAWLSR